MIVHKYIRDHTECPQYHRQPHFRGVRKIGFHCSTSVHNYCFTGVENLKHYEAYEEALQGGLTLTLRYLKFLFFGPPRSGKSSTRRRLIKEIVNLSQLSGPSISTGVAETNDVIIKKLTSEPAAIAGSQWWSMKRSNEGTQLDMYGEGELGYLAQLFYQLIYKSTTPATSSEPFPVQESDEHSKNEALDPSNLTIVPVSTNDQKAESIAEEAEEGELEMLGSDLSDTEEAEIKIAFEKLTSILQSDSPEDLKRLLEDLTMINMTDVGGQPAFLDMLPALTIGPALYFLFFRLDQELRKKYPVRFLPDEKGAEIVLETSYCIEEVLYQCLASIACFSSHSLENSKTASKLAASSRALLFGTYKDQVDDAQISSVQKTLEDKFKGTRLYKEGLLLKPLKSKMAFTVDNMHGTEKSEMSDIRNDIEGIITTCFPAIPIPVSWLMFRIVLHLLNKPVIGFAQCEEIAKQLSMSTSVKEAIWFFHHDIGSLMHYSNIPSMEDTVICDPQIIFDSISKLIIDKFQYANRAMAAGVVEEFHERGLFTLSHIQDTTDRPQNNLLKLNQLVDLLKELNILAEVKQEKELNSSNETDEQVASSNEPEPEPKFIMPAVLKHASEEELNSPILPGSEHAAPLFIHFEMGFVPFGVFSASVAHFIGHQSSTSPQWKLCDDQVRRNKLRFVIDEGFFVTLISRPQYLEIYVERHPQSMSEHSLCFICSTVRQTVVQTLETVLSDMKYKPFKTPLFPTEQPFNLAFTCSLDDLHSDHLMIVDNKSRYRAKCLKSHIAFRLHEEHLLWFNEVL